MRGRIRRRYRVPAVIAAALATVIPQLVTAAPSRALADGLNVPTGRYRFVAKLSMIDVPTRSGGSTDGACSGALISRSYIITAGHCFHGRYGKHVSGRVPYPTTVTVDTADTVNDAGITRKDQVARMVTMRRYCDALPHEEALDTARCTGIHRASSHGHARRRRILKCPLATCQRRLLCRTNTIC